MVIVMKTDTTDLILIGCAFICAFCSGCFFVEGYLSESIVSMAAAIFEIMLMNTGGE